MSIRNKDFDKDLNEIHRYISDDEKMDDKEKSEIFNLVMKKIEKEKKKKQEEQTKCKRNLKKNFGGEDKIAKVVVAALVAVIIGGTVTVGAKTMFMRTPIAKYFNIGSVNDTARKEKLEKTTGKMLQNLNISNKQNGLTVSINQIFGDDYACYLSVNVTGFQKNKKFNVLSGKGTFGEMNVDVPDKSIVQTSIHDEGMDADNSKNYLLIIGCEKMKGSHVKLQLKDFGYYNDKDEFLPVIKGTWNMDFDLTYSTNPEKYTVNKKINIYGAKAVWNDVTFTPISASVSLTMKEKNDAELPTGIKPNDELCVNFADGSSISSYDIDDDAVYNDTTNISISFSEIKNLDDIISVTFAGETYTIQPKVHLKNQSSKRYTSFYDIFRPNKEMKCLFVFSDDMHKILKKYETRSGDNAAFEKKAQKVEPVMEKDNKLNKLPSLVYLARRF